MGSWGADAKSFLTDVGNRVKRATENPRAMEYLRQRVSIEIQRGNAAAVIGTVENSKEWTELFLLSYTFHFIFIILFPTLVWLKL